MAAEVPTFHVFASEWLVGKRSEVREGTAADYQWALELHLLPHLARYRLEEITIELVDQYKRRKAREETLSPTIVNKTLTRLAHRRRRHTYGSLLAACGEDPSYVMAHLGHSDPNFTLRVYIHLMSRRDGERDRLKALVEGADWAATAARAILLPQRPSSC
jgi:hypothetical protein